MQAIISQEDFDRLPLRLTSVIFVCPPVVSFHDHSHLFGQGVVSATQKNFFL